MANVKAAYQATQGSILDVDREFYDGLRASAGERTLVASHTVPIRSGLAWEVPAGTCSGCGSLMVHRSVISTCGICITHVNECGRLEQGSFRGRT